MLDFSQVINTYEVPETGIYELKIDNVEFKQSKNGKNYISITYVIRDDVEQPSQGSRIWDNVWENETYKTASGKKISKSEYEGLTDAQKQSITITKAYNAYPISQILHTQKAENAKYSFENIEEAALFINQMCVQAKVNKYLDDKEDKERNSIDYKSMKPTSVPLEETQTAQPQKYVEISDDDLPF